MSPVRSLLNATGPLHIREEPTKTKHQNFIVKTKTISIALPWSISHIHFICLAKCMGSGVPPLRETCNILTEVSAF